MPDRPTDSAARPVVLIVRDGWGHNPHPEHDAFNAITLAQTPRCDALKDRYPTTLIQTSGRAVGLPEGTMGNSEVGHQNIGAGRVVYQESVRITVAIEDGSFFDNAAITDAITKAHHSGKQLHLMGIMSDAGVHGRLDHLYACVEAAKRAGLPSHRVCVHLFTDGRDTGPFTGEQFLAQVEAKLADLDCGRVVSLVGRYFAMDRDNRWERVESAYRLLTAPDPSVPDFATAAEALADAYANPISDTQKGDEFVTPRTIGGNSTHRISGGDSVIFYNYRGDRPRELVRAFMQPNFYGNVAASPGSGEQGFDRGPELGLVFVCMTGYDESFAGFPGIHVAFTKTGRMPEILGETLAQHGLSQLRVAETEKFPHVTFFANDYREEPFQNEARQMAQSPMVATYDLQPQMSAQQLRDIAINAIQSDACPDFILLNFANGDMVGHTGSLDAAIAAVQTVDACTGAVVDAVLEAGGKLIVTADHGNAEQMFDPTTNAPHTAHTLYDVECILVDPQLDANTPLRAGGSLADCAPTALAMLGLPIPSEMTGRPLTEV